MAEEKRCQYRRGVIKYCPHPYFVSWADPETGEEDDYCIFHAPMEAKENQVEEFWEAFERYFEKTEYEYETSFEKEKGEIVLDCFKFVFPDTGSIFEDRVFPFAVDFGFAEFSGETVFKLSIFLKQANFDNARFEKAVFYGSEFQKVANFNDVIFENEANFILCKLNEDTVFRGAEFHGPSPFHNAVFFKSVSFSYTEVSGNIYFEETEFYDRVDFRNIATSVTGNTEPEDLCKLILKYAYFHLPEKVLIGDIGSDLSLWSFLGTNIEKTRFIRPSWPRRKGRRSRKYIMDEILGETGYPDMFLYDEKITWAEVSEVYRKLRLNYENQLAYETAGDFHYGQMWCRIWDKNRARWDRILTWVYWVLFSFGESISKPLIWLAISFLLFTGFFLLHGFPLTDGPAINWDWNFGKLLTDGWWKQLGSGMLFTIRSAFSFSIPKGGTNSLAAIMFACKLVAVILATFSVLALRRRFKR